MSQAVGDVIGDEIEDVVENIIEDVTEVYEIEVDVADAVEPVPLRLDIDAEAVEGGRLLEVDETALLRTEDDDIAKFVLVRLLTPEELASEGLLVLTTELVLTPKLVLTTVAEVDVVSAGGVVVVVTRDTVALVIQLLNILSPVLEEKVAATVALELPGMTELSAMLNVLLLVISFVFVAAGITEVIISRGRNYY